MMALAQALKNNAADRREVSQRRLHASASPRHHRPNRLDSKGDRPTPTFLAVHATGILLSSSPWHRLGASGRLRPSRDPKRAMGARRAPLFCFGDEPEATASKPPR